MRHARVYVVRRRAPLQTADRATLETSSFANVFIPKRYIEEFLERVQYMEQFYSAKAKLNETRTSLGSNFLVQVSGKSGSVGAVVGGIYQWAKGCTL